jgi:hypothetical protein
LTSVRVDLLVFLHQPRQTDQRLRHPPLTIMNANKPPTM